MATRKTPAFRTLASIPLALVLVAATDAQPILIDTGATMAGLQRAPISPPREHHLHRAAPFHGDLRALPKAQPRKFERPEREGPAPHPIFLPGTTVATSPLIAAPSVADRSAPAPPPIRSFDGLDFANWGAGHPPDTNGDVGPKYFIEAVNTSIGIFNKSDGTRVAAFTFDTFMSQGHFGNLCDTDNFGDPVVLYDSFEDRWIITDFAFKLGASGIADPPGAFQCFAVSQSGDPVSGGWNFYSINIAGGLGDYPKFGVWPDGLYMSANMFDFAASGSFQNPRVYAFNKAQMYAGAPTVQVVSFDGPSVDFTLLPSNARLQTGTPPPGAPNFYVSTWEFLNALTVYKFHVDWDRVGLSTFTGPDTPFTSTSWPNAGLPDAPSWGGNSLDVLGIRAMMQNQYTNVAGAESLWIAHTVHRQDTIGSAAPRWYQVGVNAGTVAPTLIQAATWDPDGLNLIHRFIPSLAVDRAGNMALGYSTSSLSSKPAIKYAGRLSGDPPNTLSQAEQVLIQGTGAQTGNCGGATCSRWGDYSAMTLDPDGCTFWYANEYYAQDGLDDLTRIGAFTFPSCTALTNAGSLQGTVISLAGGPVVGATVALGSRTTTTDVNGFYSFSTLPPGTYPRLTVAASGFIASSGKPIADAISVGITGNGTTTRDFSLTAAPISDCLIDTTQPDFLLGTSTSSDVDRSPGDVTLLSPSTIDQRNTTLGNFGVRIDTVNWGGQTFTPALSGRATKADINLFCSLCTGNVGTNPDLTLSLRATSGGLPTGPDLATATIPGFSNDGGTYYTGMFGSPATLTAGTMYALVIRPNTNRSDLGVYALTRSGLQSSGSDVYPGGTRVIGTNGAVWSIPLTGGISTDAGFKVYMDSGFAPSGTFISGPKDSNPFVGVLPAWTRISWTATTPGLTAVLFQAAGSNTATGPFNFVGPDGTAATFFASGDSLAQFKGFRFLKYRATLSTPDRTMTPAISDVTACFDNPLADTTIAVDAVAGAFGGTVNLSAALFANGRALPGSALAFKLNGSSVGSTVTAVNGVAARSSISLAGINAGTYATGITVSFGGDPGHHASSGSNTLTVAKAPQIISFAPLADKVATDAAFALSATGGASGNPVVFSTGSTACSVAASTVTLLKGGTCAINADEEGNANFAAAPRVTQTFQIARASQSIAFPAVSSFSWSGGSATLAASANSGLSITYTVVSGPCTVTDNLLRATAAGTCLVAADQGGNDRYAPASRVTMQVVIADAPRSSSGCGCHATQTSGAAFEVALTVLAGLAMRQRRRKPRRLT